MNRKKGILAAGTLTGLVLITILGLGFGNLGAIASGSNDSNTAVPQEIPQEPQINAVATDPAAAEAVQAWQDYSAELEQTVRVMQEREAAYQSQLEQANGTIVNLQDQVNSANSAASSSGSGAYYDDDDEYEEHEEHDDDDHYEEHEDHDDDD